MDEAIMSAVDYRLAVGLSFNELKAALRIALESGRAIGIKITIYNPRLDRNGSAGRGLVAALAEALGTGAPTAVPGQFTVHDPFR